MLKKFKIPLLLLAAGAVVYFLFFKNKTALTGITTNSTVDNAVVKRFPPPGYSGPGNIGPFNWAGMGEPTHGQTFIGWTQAEAKAKGYNWS
jgi:hypothetical protein